MTQLYPDIPEEELSSNLYPDLSDKDEDVSSTTKPVFRKHLEKHKNQKPDPVKENEDKTEESSWDIYKYTIAILSVLSSILFLLYKYACSVFQHQKTAPTLPQYLEEIEKLEPYYGQQTDVFWNIIRSFPYYLLSDKYPEGPAVLLMVAPAGNLSLALKLSKQLAGTLNKLLNSHPKHSHVVDGKSLTSQNPDVQKMMIDDQIRTLVDNHGQRVVIVTNLEKIDPNAIMIFHGYCDNNEAVYKKIAIILLLELPAGVHVDTNEEVYTHLSQIWSSLGRSKNHALFTRLANNIAILKAK